MPQCFSTKNMNIPTVSFSVTMRCFIISMQQLLRNCSCLSGLCTLSVCIKWERVCPAVAFLIVNHLKAAPAGYQSSIPNSVTDCAGNTGPGRRGAGQHCGSLKTFVSRLIYQESLEEKEKSNQTKQQQTEPLNCFWALQMWLRPLTIGAAGQTTVTAAVLCDEHLAFSHPATSGVCCCWKVPTCWL